MANITDVCNIALGFLGKSRIADINEESEPARQCKLMYDMTKQHLLRHYDWGFAKKIEHMALLDVKHPKWHYVYVYPNKCVRVMSIFNNERGVCVGRGDKDKYELFLASDNVVALACDVKDAYIEYIYDIDDMNVVPSDFLEAFAHMLASNIALQLTGNETLKNNEYQLAVSALSDARYHSAMERKREPEYPDKYTRARV